MSVSCTNIDLDAFAATKAAVQEDPSCGRGNFTTTTVWSDGARAHTTARSFAIETDEPAPLGGSDKAIDPMELLLAAIGTCVTIGWVTQAALRNIVLRSLSIDVTGEYDLRGYLSIDQAVRPGFTGISYVVNVDTDAPSNILEEINRITQAGSPMVDNVVAATAVVGVVRR